MEIIASVMTSRVARVADSDRNDPNDYMETRLKRDLARNSAIFSIFGVNVRKVVCNFVLFQSCMP